MSRASAADESVIRSIFAALADSHWDVAIDLVELHWASLLRTAPHAVHAVAFALPEDQRRRDSRRWRHLVETRQLILRTSPPSVHSPGDHAGELLLYLTELTEQASQMLDRGAVASARGAVRHAVAFYRAMAEQQRRAAAHALPQHLLSWARMMQAVDDASEGRNLLEEAYAWSISIGQVRPAIESAGELAADDALRGRMSSAQQWVQRATILHRANSDASGTPPAVQFASAVMAADGLAFPQALAHLAQSKSVPFYDHERVCASFGTIWRSFLPAPESAELTAELDRACASSPRSHLGRITEMFARVRLDLLEGYRHRAVARFASVSEEQFGVWISAGRAALHLRLGDIRAAELDASFARERVADSPRSVVELQAIQAALHFRKSQHELARDSFRAAVEMAELHALPAALLAAPLSDLRSLAEITYHDAPPVILARLLSTVADEEAVSPTAAKLTVRELAVLRALSVHPDARIAGIAEHLEVSRNTIKTQLRSIYRKLGTSERARALEIVREAGVLVPDSAELVRSEGCEAG
ncbi:LuxR C-terminal-related transcriptional regulator [Microbacterium sp. 2MCAF23]|uniref:LuxR C-terminal-related transcriptional regulator n=1 Tax=Microbacterium sp. 2MCAF23 TaxID=3232985 RepID=UPI003F94F448